jgi:peptidoglycan/LPS O-acetylase OafA/YrhL
MRIHKLDGLRGFFCVMVVLYHYDEQFLPKEFYNFFLLRHSYAFVDFFFVLSGFVISLNYSQMNKKSEFLTYIKKRFIRLFPLLLFSTFSTFLYEFSRNEFLKDLYPSIFENSFSHDFMFYFIKLLNSLTFTDSTPIFGVIQGFNGVSWSISAEMIAYIVFGLVLVFLHKLKNYFFLTIIIGSILFLFIAGEYYSVFDYGFLRGLVSFHLGYFVFVLSKYKVKLNNYIELFLPLFVALLFYLYSKQSISFYANILGSLISLSFALCIYVLLNTNGFISRILDTKIFQFLGKISYSIYLNHILFIIIVPKFFFKFFHLKSDILNQFLVCVSYLFIVIIYSNFTYKFIEMKAGKAFKNFLTK